MKLTCHWLVFAAAAMAQPEVATAQSRDQGFAVAWKVVEAPSGNGSFLLKERQSVPLGRIVPAATFKLSVPVSEHGGREILPAGALLAWNSLSRDIACEPIRRRRQLAFICLRDTDRDGSFDGFNRIRAIGRRGGEELEYLIGLHIVGGYKKLPSAIAPMAIEEAPPVPPIPLSLRFVGFSIATIGRDSGLAPCVSRDFGPGILGARVEDEICAPAQGVWRIALPFTYKVAGATVNITSRVGGRIAFSVQYPRVGSSL